MRTKEAKKHFGGSKAAVARAIGVTRSAVQQWGDFPPDEQQLKLQQVTEGALKAEPEVLAKFRALGEQAGA